MEKARYKFLIIIIIIIITIYTVFSGIFSSAFYNLVANWARK